MLLELMREMGLNPKRVASTHGGEYHSSCPTCGGRDRFFVHPNRQMKRCIGAYCCRQCQQWGDSIKFCKEIMGMDYESACDRLHVNPIRAPIVPLTGQWSLERVAIPFEAWSTQAKLFIPQWHKNLLQTPFAIELLTRRGFSMETIKRFSLGWNSENQFFDLAVWGQPLILNDRGNAKKIWVPEGIIVPLSSQNELWMKLKVRRTQWVEGKGPKYVEVTGSMKCSALYGDRSRDVVIVVESELDAILIQQFAADLCACVAIGGVSKTPDFATHMFLRSRRRILLSLDFDAAGKRTTPSWRAQYPNSIFWPVPREKSPGDYLQAGGNIREWVVRGIKNDRGGQGI